MHRNQRERVQWGLFLYKHPSESRAILPDICGVCSDGAYPAEAIIRGIDLLSLGSNFFVYFVFYCHFLHINSEGIALQNRRELQRLLRPFGHQTYLLKE